MQESRKKAKKKKEETRVRRLLDESRSDTLYLMESPDFESIPGLSRDLNDFVQQNSAETCGFSFEMKSDFYMNDYRNHILSTLGWSRVHFSDIGSLIDNYHLDRVRRFITLIFMQNDNKVELTQQGEDLFVQRVYNEAYN